MTRTRLHLVPGTQDPKAPHVPASQKTGLVAPGHLSSVLAIFNGGFQEQHGRWGFMSEGTTYVTPRPNGCTLSILADGRVSIASVPDSNGSAEVLAFRQTPPCLVEGGNIHETLLRGNDRAWGGKVADLKTRRRSAVGVDASGTILFYGLGEEVDARYLAEGMRLAGASSAAQLDINWNWTRFLLVGKKGAGSEPEITSTLVVGMPHGKREYLSRPSERDFFYVRRGDGP